ncbi:Hypothetical protein D9617_21g097780 [Elsinoe fawcettii]|nr:Hypothetical protein D9617_21g097780 [Elsinoe fawcettii]
MNPARSRAILASIALSLLLFLLSLITLSLSPRSWSLPRPILLSPATTDLTSSLAHAEQLWRQSVTDRRRMAVDSGKARFPDGYTQPYTVWDFLRPTFYCPLDLERVVGQGEGGKWVCGMARYERLFPPATWVPDRGGRQERDAGKMVVYFCGVGGGSSFEAGMLRRTNAEVWGWDPTVDGWVGEIKGWDRSRVHFEKFRLGPKTDEKARPQVWSIWDLMKRNGHEFVDVMKIDVEGEEFEALTALMDTVSASGERSLPVGQMLIELHLLDDQSPPTPKSLQTLLQWWGKLEAMGMRPTHNEHHWVGDVGSSYSRFVGYTLINARNERNRLLFTQPEE